MLLARQGLRVLLAAPYGADTCTQPDAGGCSCSPAGACSSGSVAAGTPPIRRTRFDYGAATPRIGTGAGTVVYGHWSHLHADGYEWFYRLGSSAGMTPTNGGQVCVFAGVPAHRLRTGAGTLRETCHRLLAVATGGRLAGARPPDRLYSWVGRPGFVRQPHGPGWALAGDAGSCLDPLSTHGITDALRDAQCLARSLADAGGPAGSGGALDRSPTTATGSSSHCSTPRTASPATTGISPRCATTS